MKAFLSKIKIPNVMSFEIVRGLVNETALYYGVMVQKKSLADIKSRKRLTRSNRYLKYQFKRLYKLSKNPVAFNILAVRLMTRSHAFKVYAINSVYPRWIFMLEGNLKRLIRALNCLTRNHKTDIIYTRVWIDKKPGDYGRPLGVPEIVWRIYMRMATNIGEIWSHGRNDYVDFQHGGRAGYGVNTCLLDLIEKLKTYKYAWEFDLRGFFDNINKSAVKDFFKGLYLQDYYFKMLLAKPKSYKLPEPSQDLATSKWIEAQEVEILQEFYPLPVSQVKFEYIRLTEEEIKALSEDPEFGEEMRDNLKVLEKLDQEDKEEGGTPIFRNEKITQPQRINIGDCDLSDLHESDRELLESLGVINRSLKDEYKDLMTNDIEVTKMTEIFNIHPGDREEGRDNWKGLLSETQGIPQGSAFGPFFASIVAASSLKAWRNQLLMYIDDGFIFGNTINQIDKVKSKVSKKLSHLGVSFAEEKCGYINSAKLISEGIKFLGTRIKKASYSTFTMSSETRRGTKKAMPILDSERMLELLESLMENGKITISKYKVMKWYTTSNAEMRDMLDKPTLEVAIKYKFFNQVLAFIYDPSPSNDINGLRQLIREGMAKANDELSTTRGNYADCIMNMDSGQLGKELEEDLICRPNLYNVSTLASELLLKHLGNDRYLKVSPRRTKGLKASRKMSSVEKSTQDKLLKELFPSSKEIK